MKIDAGGISGSSLRLGIQSNVERFEEDCISRAKNWAPKKAKSFTIDKVIHTDYHGYIKRELTGYATIVVSYYSSMKEGEHTLVLKGVKDGIRKSK